MLRSRANLLTLPITPLRGSIAGPEHDLVPFSPREGPPAGWSVRESNQLMAPVNDDVWTVQDGIRTPAPRRGTSLVSNASYGDFTLAFEIKRGEVGNSGVALSAPTYGDTTFDLMELQVADYRTNTRALDSMLRGGISGAIIPAKQVRRPTEWNLFVIELKGDDLKVPLNGMMIQDIDLTRFDERVRCRDGTNAAPAKDRPRKGHLGFQQLGESMILVRLCDARIKVA